MNCLIEDEALARIIELRQYDKFEKLVGNLLENGSWSGLLEQIVQIENKPEAVKGWEMPLRTGVIRDAIINVLDLKRLNGLDGDLLDIFIKLNADKLDELRLQAEIHSHKLLEKQIRKGNTFFLEIDELKDNSSAALIPDIIKAQQKQIESIDKDSSFREIYSTYYGFAVLTQGSIIKDSGGVSLDALQELESLLVISPEVVQSRKQIMYSSSLFGRVTSYTRKLLWNLLRICIGGGQHQVVGAVELGNSGDSRAVGLLRMRLLGTKTAYLAMAMVDALAAIGIPECFELVKSWGEKERGRRYRVLDGIGKIRHPDVFDLIMNRFVQSGRTGIPDAIFKMMGYTRDLQFVPILSNIIDEKRYGKSRIAALGALKMLGATDEAKKRIDGILSEKYYIIATLDLLSRFPEVEWSKEQIELVISGIKGWPYKKVRDSIERIPALLENGDVQQVLRDLSSE